LPTRWERVYSGGMADFAREEIEETIAEAVDAVERNPLNASYHSYLARAYIASGEYQGALKALKQVLALDPSDTNAWHTLGRLYIYKLQDLKLGTQALERAVKVDPNIAAVWQDLVESYLDLDRPQEAIRAGQKAVEVEPGEAEAWSALGVAYSLSSD